MWLQKSYIFNPNFFFYPKPHIIFHLLHQPSSTTLHPQQHFIVVTSFFGNSNTLHMLLSTIQMKPTCFVDQQIDDTRLFYRHTIDNTMYHSFENKRT